MSPLFFPFQLLPPPLHPLPLPQPLARGTEKKHQETKQEFHRSLQVSTRLSSSKGTNLCQLSDRDTHRLHLEEFTTTEIAGEQRDVVPDSQISGKYSNFLLPSSRVQTRVCMCTNICNYRAPCLTNYSRYPFIPKLSALVTYGKINI